jgi:hypothetical protein
MADSQGVTLVTLIPTGWSRFYMYGVLRWVLRYTSFYSAFRRFLGRSKRLGNPALFLEALNFIHYGRWVIVQKAPLKGWGSSGLPTFGDQIEEKSDHGFLLFTSNFDDEWPGYVDTFMEAARDDLGVFWNHTPGWKTPKEAGFEGFFTFVNDHKVDHLDYYAAFPGLATSDIKAALAVDRHVRSFAIQTTGTGDTEWNHAFDLLVSKVQYSLGYIRPTLRIPTQYMAGGGIPVGLTSLAPFPMNKAQKVRNAITSHAHAGVSRFAAVAGTHFARLTVIDQVRDSGTLRTLNSGYVLMSVDADGSLGSDVDWLERLYVAWSRITPTGSTNTLIDLIWGECYEFGSVAGKEQFRDYIAKTSFKPTVPFADYPSTSLWDIRRALDTHAWFTDFVFAGPGKNGFVQADFVDLFASSCDLDPPPSRETR